MPAPKNAPPTLKKLYASAGLDPGMVSSWSQQEGGMLGQYGDTVALLKTDRARMLQSLRQQQRDIRTQKTQDLRSAAGAANDRGVLGSSADVTARQDVISGAAAQRMAARDAYSQGLIQNRMQKTQAQRDLMMGLAGLQGQRAAARAAAGNNAYMQKLFDEFVNAGGGGGGGRGPGADAPASVKGKWLRRLAGAKGIKGVANRIEGLGGGLFDVDELEGYQGVSSVTGGHSANSKHYLGRAFDVNTTRGNNTPLEKRKLKQLAAALQHLYGIRLDEVISPEANAGMPGWHGHFAFNTRKWGRTGNNRSRPAGAPTGQQRG